VAIKCPKCHHDNPADTLYCGKCATKLDIPAEPSLTLTLETSAEELSRGTLFAGRSRGIFLFQNKGKSWKEVNSGLTIKDIRALAVSGAYLFAGTQGYGVWRLPLSEITSKKK